MSVHHERIKNIKYPKHVEPCHITHSYIKGFSVHGYVTIKVTISSPTVALEVYLYWNFHTDRIHLHSANYVCNGDSLLGSPIYQRIYVLKRKRKVQ